jgi:Tol biopolymer transport system component
MDADGSHQRRLTSKRFNEGTPAFSPDGRRIVYGRTRRLRDDTDLYVMNADGTHKHALLTGPNDDFLPVWGPRAMVALSP